MKSIKPLYEVHFDTPGFDGETRIGSFVGTYAECEALADKTAGYRYGLPTMPGTARMRAPFSIVPVEWMYI